jgi:hypothetical protein
VRWRLTLTLDLKQLIFAFHHKGAELFRRGSAGIDHRALTYKAYALTLSYVSSPKGSKFDRSIPRKAGGMICCDSFHSLDQDLITKAGIRTMNPDPATCWGTAVGTFIPRVLQGTMREAIRQRD